MTRCISWEDKGKAKATDYAPPRIRVKAPNLDTSNLIQKHKLTLVGRVTNPREQRIGVMIPYLIRKWSLKGNVTGSDLGRDCFQFMFELAEDLEKILANRPHHYEHWMLIIQRWEPIISPTFPAYIPFWIELKGIPLHYWQRDLLDSIGEELGGMIKYELTSTTARIKVHINGLQPLVKESVIEYASGEESIVALEYEKLENHCRRWHRLTHDTYNCKEVLPTEPETRVSEPEERERYSDKNHKGDYGRDREFTRRYDRHGNPFGDRTSSQRAREGETRGDSNKNPADQRGGTRYQWREKTPPRSPRNRADLRQVLRNREEERRKRGSQKQIWREKERGLEKSPRERETSRTASSADTNPPPLERTLDFTGIPTSSQVPTEDEVMADLQEVTARYVNCGDPIESEARRQRVLQGEMEGLMATTAARIVAAASEERSPPPAPAPKKRGRPPLVRKSVGKSPMSFKGASSMKRRINQIQNSPRRQTAQRIHNNNLRASASGTSTLRPQPASGNPTNTAQIKTSQFCDEAVVASQFPLPFRPLERPPERPREPAEPEHGLGLELPPPIRQRGEVEVFCFRRRSAAVGGGGESSTEKRKRRHRDLGGKSSAEERKLRRRREIGGEEEVGGRERSAEKRKQRRREIGGEEEVGSGESSEEKRNGGGGCRNFLAILRRTQGVAEALQFCDGFATIVAVVTK
ncbi:unnamed protein product [Microthlaspi erraticum]|uniref:DUF4283 domain-containing protein n=1 Tax=Microthlaspi erraticum TaxID=1685480 RepID=A0A6D2I7D6_9BRAS|nr:unnamed protein product [Microthlaspi erraticum]